MKNSTTFRPCAVVILLETQNVKKKKKDTHVAKFKSVKYKNILTKLGTLVHIERRNIGFWKRGEKEKKKRREREESDKSGDRTCGDSA